MRGSQMYPNLMAKRFPVAKRSSNYYPIPFTDEMPRQFKRSSHLNKNNEKLMQTDPKVAHDLSSIFGHNSNRKFDNKHGEEDKVVSKPKRTEHATETSKSSETTVKMATTQKPNHKLNISERADTDEKEKPIQIKKKSIDWSDYFGLDKRKKPDNNLDNEWLMERYHKAVALTSKRNHENDDDNNKGNKTKSASTTDEKINDMDNKLKNIEYAIVDRALKASTTSDETEFDTKEEQEMKDRIISQLAAAYSLEKMRRALNEYRESIKKERLALKTGRSNDNRKAEEKRLSVPRKSAGDLEVVSADNNIKCANTDENCVEQNYKTPEELLDNINFGTHIFLYGCFSYI